MKTRLRHVARVNPASSRFDWLADDDLVPFLPMENVWPGTKLDLTEVRVKSSVATGYTRFETGDVVVPKITPTFEASRSVLVPKLPDSVGVGTTELHVVRAGPEIDPRYLLYIFHSHPFLRIGAAQMYGVAGQKRIPDDLIRDWPVELPTLDAQRRVADFLDAETARLDELILLRSTQTDRLAEALRSDAAILTGRHHGRTQELPPEWQRLPVRRVVEGVQTGLTPTDSLKAGLAGDLPWYTPAALGDTLELGEAEKSVDLHDAQAVPQFPAGSVLLVGIGESLGKVAELDHAATGNQQLTAIKTGSSIDRRFLTWQLFGAREELRTWAQYSRVRILNNDNLKSFPIWLPSLSSQVASRQELDRRLRELVDFRAAAALFAQLASERRRALITAAVTGQIDVTTARGVAPSGG